ncbi:MAG: endonuclease III [Candidatus Tectomicrobia bacterium]|uniref:Endonuclease III n=1 Tax=Tectimicrobiota bacterium TaxID=2528274 RepID=A0A932FWR1_UNCTE|nr:endonuclease III [Candidatus Tectomicrobia bacterium]
MSKAQQILEILQAEYPDARITLNYSNPLELLIATILAAQCTDERVNQVTQGLFRKYRTPEDYVRVDPRELEEDIRSTGFYKNKAKSIVGCCQKLLKDFGGAVPATEEGLLTLPGVGRKTAHLVLGNAFGQPALAVDTHVKRVAQRLGLAHSSDPDEVERELCRQIPPEQWVQATHLLVFHGRKVCQAKRPLTERCRLRELCDWHQTKKGG